MSEIAQKPADRLEIAWLTADDVWSILCQNADVNCFAPPVVKVTNGRGTKFVLCHLHGREFAAKHNLAYPNGEPDPWANQRP